MVAPLSSAWRLVMWAMFCALPLGVALAQVLPQDAPQRSIGTVNCSSGTCHGATVPWNGAPILHNEYTTWLRLDRHARAFDVLSNDASRRIAQNLGMDKPPAESKLCLDCHTHNVAPEKRGERFVLSDGVSCEACHGPAEKWVATHVAPGARHADNIANGMVPLERPDVLAKVCLSCHLGSADKLANHRLMAAGHPRLIFELDTFAVIEPWHAKPMAENAALAHMRIWAVGQAVAASAQLRLLADPKRSRDGMFPELVLFDCHACHHAMSDKRWRPQVHPGPGLVRLNDANLVILRNILKVASPDRSAAFEAQTAVLAKAVAAQPGVQDVPLQATKLADLIDAQVPVLQSFRYDNQVMLRLMNLLIDDGMADAFTDYAGAEQAFMAISGVGDNLHRQGALPGVLAFNQSLAAMRKTLADGEHYQPERFKQDLSRLKGLLAGTVPNTSKEQG